MKKYILTLVHAFFHFLIVVFKVTADNYTFCKFETIFSNRQNYSIIYFTNVLNFNQIDTNLCAINITTKLNIVIYPSQNLVFDSSLKLSRIRLLDHSSFFLRLKIANLNGFDLNNRELYLFTTKYSNLSLELDVYYSKFNVYSNESNECDQLRFVNHSLFYKISNFILRKTVDFKQSKICEQAFRNAQINMFSIMSNENSFLNRNIFEFSADNSSSLNSTIWSLYMCSFRIDLTTRILNERVFKQLNMIYLAGTLRSIQKDIFKNFPLLNTLVFDLSDARRFFHTIRLDWLESMNRDVTSYKLIIFLVRLNLIAYEFPEEDFCLFYKFPFYRSVYSMVLFDRVVNNCSCTLLYLTRLQHKTKEKMNLTLSFGQANYILNEDHTNFSFVNSVELKCSNFLDVFEKCNFTKRLTKCDSSTLTNDFVLITDYYELNYFLNYSKFIINVIVFPLLCFMSFVINILSYLVITNKKKKELFKHEFCSYMKYYFVFNIILSVMFQFKLINICLGFTSVYCSRIRTSYVTQYVHILAQYLSKVLKFCSNFCLVMISFSRYQMFTSNNTKMVSIRKVKVIISSCALLSLVINSSKLFEYKIVNINKLEGNTIDYPLFKISPLVCDFTNLSCFLLYLFDLISDLVNDIVCFVCNTVIDVFLVIFLRQKLQQSEKSLFKKRKILKGLVKMNLLSLRENLRDYKNKRTNVVNKLAITTFLNGVIVLLTRLPESISFILNLAAKFTLNKFCYVFSDCSILIHLTDFFYLISFVLIFLINLTFNENFKNSFKQIVHLNKKSIFKKLVLFL